MKDKLLTRKKLVIVIALVIVALLAAGVWYHRYKTNTNCISYYDKDGKSLLYQDCR